MKTSAKIVTILLVVSFLALALLEILPSHVPNTSTTTVSTTLPEANQTEYLLTTAFLNNSNNYYAVQQNIPKSSPLYVFPNNSTEIFYTELVNMSAVNRANTSISTYAIVELFPSASQAGAAFSFRRQDIMNEIAAGTGNFSAFQTPTIGNLTFGFEEAFYSQNQTLYAVQYALGNAFVRVGTYETLNSSTALPIALAEKFARQISANLASGSG